MMSVIQLLTSFRLLATCEGLVKRHYSLLGWEYQYTCSDDEISTTEYGRVKEQTHMIWDYFQ